MSSTAVEECTNDLPNGAGNSNRLACIFPTLTDGYIPDRTKCNGQRKIQIVELGVLNPAATTQHPAEAHEIAPEVSIATAWALTLSRYIGTDKVSFYVFLNSESMLSASLCDLTVHESQTQWQLLHQTHDDLYGIKSRCASLKEITVHELWEKFSSKFSNTVIVFEDESSNGAANVIDEVRKNESFLILNVSRIKGTTNAYLSYQHSMLSDGQAVNLSTSFTKVLLGLGEKPYLSIGQVDYMSQAHLDQIWRFNSNLPEPWLECFHDVVERHATNRPWAPAIDAWDVKFTYNGLVTLATRLAKYLQDHGVGPGVVVPICFERSAWALVAMFAVSKAGGAFVSIPPYLPPGRVDVIIEMIASPILLTTSDYGHMWDGRINWIAIEGNRINCLPNCKDPPTSRTKPTDMFYVIFTSGSTGLPKGCTLSHTSFLNGALRKAPEWKFGPDSRVLQMLSHTFDMSLLEICTSLGSGACVCIPRAEEIEESLANAINKYGVNLAVMTPSLARALEPEAVPGLKTLCLGGEAFPKEIVNVWSERINLFQFYGPSECSINSSTRAITRKDADPLNIGFPNCAACWVVMPNDHNRLVPIGSIGELLVSGPIVGLGYLKDDAKTSRVFLEDVAFLQDDPVHRGFRFYKTGDLVRWNSDGTLTFCGRADTQIKLNGQRLELGEVEYHLTLDENVHLAMALVPNSGRCRRNLVAVIALKLAAGNRNHTEDISPLNGKLDHSIRKVVKRLRTRLQNALPRYMVPTIWTFIARMPMSASGKIDRVIIREWVEDMSETTFLEITGGGSEPMDRPEYMSTLEQQIQEVWSYVLDLPKQRIGLHQPFISLGGDSISAQQVVARCREGGIKLTVMDILVCDGVAGAASLASSPTKDDTLNTKKPGFNFRALWDNLRDGYDLSSLSVSQLDEIEDVYPCIPMQVGMFIGQIRRPGSYHLRFFYKVTTKTGRLPDLGRIKAAWHTVVARHPSLRTVFVDDLAAGAVYHSVVLRQPSIELRVWEIPANTSSSEVIEIFTHSLTPFSKNSPFHRLTLCVSNGDITYLSLEISHALVDGAALEVVIRDFVHVCNERQLSCCGPTYRDFVGYQTTRDMEESAQYWMSYLENSAPCMFPVNTQTTFDSMPTRFLRRDFDFERSEAFLSTCRERHMTIASAIRAAWALVLRTYTGSCDVCFGYLSAGRNIPIKDVDRTVGLCLSIQPCRARLGPDTTLANLAWKLQQDFIESLPHHHYPLSELKARLYPKDGEMMFNTAISMEWTAKPDWGSNSSISLEEIREQDDPTEYDIAISVEASNDHLKLGFLYWPSITYFEMTHIGNAFKRALNCFLDHADVPIDSLSLFGDSGIGAMNRLNHSLLDSVETTVLKFIEQQTELQPDAPAILSWDGEFSYRQVAELSSKLATELINQGVGRGDYVIGCLDKSCWSIITILAIVRLGAVFVAANPSQPQQRLKAIIEHCCPRLVITNLGYIALFDNIHTRTIAIPQTAIESIPPLSPSVTLPTVNSDDIVTVIYTSGSTGEPKGILMDHGSLATSALVGHGRTFKFSRETRTLQFASFTFDASLLEIFTTLAHGGCICVPSEDERLSDLTGSINRMQANLAVFTPTVARIIRPGDVPCLKTVVLAGEPMSRQDVETWAESVDLYNGYGPAEATVCVSAHGPMKRTDDPRNLGHAVDGTRLWITEVADDKRLAPVGCVGELLVESRQVTQGYLHDTEKTEAVFVENPTWLAHGNPGRAGRHGRICKTGDLVRYNPDGSLCYIGRKDTQIKLRGQRVELGEVEHRMRECVPETQVVVAEVIKPAGEDKVMLVAFLCCATSCHGVSMDDTAALDGVISEALSARPVAVPRKVKEQLEERLPCYMVPAVFFAMSTMPITVSGKTDRKRLREIGSAFSAQQLAEAQSRQKSNKRAPSTENERQLQQLWAQILNIDPNQISLDDGFFRLGGDSVAAMKLVAAARRVGMTFSVADVFRNSHIEDLARFSASQSTPPTVPFTPEPEPFSYVQQEELEGIISQMETSPSLETTSNISDVLPATDMQAFYAALAAESSSQALHYFYLDFGRNADLDRLRKACHDIVDHFPILRTIFVLSSGKTWQVVLHKLLPPFEVHDTTEDLCQACDTFCLQDMRAAVQLGYPFLSFTLVQHRHLGSRLIFRLSHAQFDGMSLLILLQSLKDAYLGMALSPTSSFSIFISHALRRRSESRAYWSQLLRGSMVTQVTAVLAVGTCPGTGLSRISVTNTVAMPVLTDDITVASFVSSAWSLVLARLTGKTDVVYGYVVSGRNGNISRIQDIVGPCMNTVPIRVRLSAAWTTTDLLHHVMDQHVSMGGSDSLGFQDILENCTQWPAGTKLDSMLQYHDIDEHPVLHISDSITRLQWFEKPYGVPSNLEVSAYPKGDRLKVSITAGSHIINAEKANTVLAIFCDALGGLSDDHSLPLTSLRSLFAGPH